MKKVIYVLSALALMAGFTACNEKEDNGGINLDEIVLDGFYVYGEATGTTDVLAKNAMSAGSNEVDKTVRTGMYEKYIWLEANKDFSLIENSAGNKKYYGANLTEVNYGYDVNDPNCKNYENNPNMIIQQGLLVIGEDAPAMQVKETGLYHIVLDNNANGDLPDGAQIVIQKAEWGVRGQMTANWDYIKGEESKNADGSITYTWTNQDMPANGKFKFASANGWKINLDADNKVKAEISLGVTDGKLSNTGDDIVAGEKAGLYTITLTYNCKAGAIGDSFSYTTELTQESTLPTEMYMTGDAFGNWTWGSEGIVKLIPTNVGGNFWAIRYLEANKGIKLSSINVKDDWSKAFGGLSTNNGNFTQDDMGNAVVAESGLYLIYADMANNILTIEPAVVYGIGDTWGAWNEAMESAKFTASEDGKTLSITAPAAGPLRMYAAYSGAEAGTWWTREFHAIDGKITYRGGGDELTPYQLTAGQVVTLDFNAGTVTIQ